MNLTNKQAEQLIKLFEDKGIILVDAEELYRIEDGEYILNQVQEPYIWEILTEKSQSPKL